MSWDVSLYKFTRRYKTLEDIPADAQPLALGSLQELQAAVSSVFLATNWNDPHWGVFDAEFGSIEFNVGKDDPVLSLALHVRAGEAVVGGILQLCERMGCQAIDLTDSSFLDQSEHPEASLRQWQKYRDHVLASREI
jgi:hypothetical protein